MNYVIHTTEEIEGIRRAARMVAEVLEELSRGVDLFTTTLDLDARGRELIEAKGAECAFHGYYGFPGHICVSLNDAISAREISSTRNI